MVSTCWLVVTHVVHSAQRAAVCVAIHAQATVNIPSMLARNVLQNQLQLTQYAACTQVRDLMVYLEAQQQVQASGEMAQGTVLPVSEPAPAPKRKGSRGRGRQ